MLKPAWRLRMNDGDQHFEGCSVGRVLFLPWGRAGWRVGFGRGLFQAIQSGHWGLRKMGFSRCLETAWSVHGPLGGTKFHLLAGRCPSPVGAKAAGSAGLQLAC